MVCQFLIGKSQSSYRYIADSFSSPHKLHMAYQIMLVPFRGTTTLNRCSHLHKTLDLGPISSYLSRSDIWCTCLGYQWYSSYMGYLVFLCDSL